MNNLQTKCRFLPKGYRKFNEAVQTYLTIFDTTNKSFFQAMRHHLSYLHLPLLASLFLLALLPACGGDQASKPNDKTAPPPTATPADNRPPTYLDGVYATSERAGQEIQNLFDDNPATGWQTLAGAGPDEGIMLYFAKPTPLQAVELTPLEGAFAEGAITQLYVNGQMDGSGAPGAKIELDPAAKPVRSLFIRFSTTGKEQTSTRKDGETDISMASFPQNASIGLADLKVYHASGQTLRLVPPTRIRGKISASSTLAPEAAYSPANLSDARKEFVWVEGNTTNSGEGEFLRFEFEQAVHITAVQVWNGYQRSEEHRKANARIRDFEFGANGSPAAAYTLGDYGSGQKVELKTPAQGNVFTLKIKSIYPGNRYKDLAVSDIVFYDGAQPFVLQSSLPAQYQTALRAQSAASPLAALLNRRISNSLQEPLGGIQQSIILRADGTFVLYSADIGEDGAESETLADGNWELLEADAQSARLKVFGKWYDMTLVAEYYKGSSQREVTKIFNDVLLIENGQLKGGKMIGTFYLK